MAAETQKNKKFRSKPNAEQTPDKEQPEYGRAVIGIGASAGGLEFLSELFANITLKTLCERGQTMGVKRQQDHRFNYFI